MPKKMTTEEFVEKAKAVHGDVYDYSDVEYKSTEVNVKIRCFVHGIFEQTPHAHLAGQGCPTCSYIVRGKRKRLLKSDFISRANEIHNYKYDYSKVDYVNSRTKVIIVCPKHGEFEQKPNSHLNGKGCAKCSGVAKLTTEEFIKKAREVHSNKYDYSKVDYIDNKKEVIIICPEHGEFKQTSNSHLCGKGCAKCSGIAKLTTEEFIKKAREVHGDRYDYSKVEYVDTKTKVCIICSKHGEFEQMPNHHLRGCDCPKCVMSGTSKPELRMCDLLCEIFGKDDVVWHYKSDLYPYECDYYIKSRNLYIELNAYWMHRFHWYDGNSDDILILQDWMSSFESSSMYKSAVNTWIVRDVEKRDTARKNNLNYIVFWKNDLSDFEEWVELGCPDGQDWNYEYSWKKGSGYV